LPGPEKIKNGGGGTQRKAKKGGEHEYDDRTRPKPFLYGTFLYDRWFFRQGSDARERRSVGQAE
jgi:hypothetical protein